MVSGCPQRSEWALALRMRAHRSTRWALNLIALAVLNGIFTTMLSPVHGSGLSPSRSWQSSRPSTSSSSPPTTSGATDCDWLLALVVPAASWDGDCPVDPAVASAPVVVG